MVHVGCRLTHSTVLSRRFYGHPNTIFSTNHRWVVGRSLVRRPLCCSLLRAYLELFPLRPQLFGPLSLAALEADEFRRATAGFAPEAELLFIDEVFKASSAILNTMLAMLNERSFDNGPRRSSLCLPLRILEACCRPSCVSGWGGRSPTILPCVHPPLQIQIARRDGPRARLVSCFITL